MTVGLGDGLPLWHGFPDPKGDAVSATVLYMSMSLDGFIAGPIVNGRIQASTGRPAAIQSSIPPS